MELEHMERDWLLGAEQMAKEALEYLLEEKSPHGGICYSFRPDTELDMAGAAWLMHELATSVLALLSEQTLTVSA